MAGSKARPTHELKFSVRIPFDEEKILRMKMAPRRLGGKKEISSIESVTKQVRHSFLVVDLSDQNKLGRLATKK